MPRIQYVPKNFAAKTLAIIRQANDIIEQYQADGFDLTLRQLYYQFVARDLLANTEQNYDRLGGIISDARLAGLIDWHAIEDRTRNVKSLSHWDNPADIMAAIAEQYTIDRWDDQPCRVEVWIEKEALAGVIADVCRDNDVAYFACRGYVSQSEMWSAAQRLKVYEDAGQTPVVIHLGDHDPSGIDMTRDITDRLEVFDVREVKVNRIALTMAQIEQYDPPPNPAKQTDCRFAGYAAEYGESSWELDALDPHQIVELVQETINHYRGGAKWRRACNKQKAERGEIKRVAEEWDNVVEWLGGRDSDDGE